VTTCNLKDSPKVIQSDTNSSRFELSVVKGPKRGETCFHPAIHPNETLILDLWTTVDIYDDICEASSANLNCTKTLPTRSKWGRVDTCSGLKVSLQESMIKYDNCTILLPLQSRYSGSEPLKAKFVLFRQKDYKTAQHLVGNIILAEAFFDLTRTEEKWNKTLGRHVRIPHYKYGQQLLVIRLVEEFRGYANSLERGDGIFLHRHNGPCTNPSDLYCYKPILYVDDIALRSTSWVEMASPSHHLEKPPVKLRMVVSTISPLRDTLSRQAANGMQIAESILHHTELNEIKYLISDENLYRFALTQMISFIHLWLDFLAFRDEVRFYVGRRDMGGLSISSVLSRFICSLIIFLFLWDAGSTSWLVLSSVGMGVATDGWKSWKVLKPTFSYGPPFVHLRDPLTLSKVEAKTINLDRIARTYLGLLLYPLLVGSALYAKQTYVYKTLWSWFISNAANAVYTFGFIALCPQLYINYRLKSVAHLPWKVFVYKVFNTFIDDVFAFLIEMPLKHKLMTLRDDVVFLGFLYQAYIYRVDKSRPNEFGYAYDEGKREEKTPINPDDTSYIGTSNPSPSTHEAQDKSKFE